MWPGETKVFLGESGSGKTLIMKMAAGLLSRRRARLVMGHDLNEMNERDLLDFRRHIGFVFQEGALFDSLDRGGQRVVPAAAKKTWTKTEMDSACGRR